MVRLAVYEILFEEDIPEGVAINEAVELAKSLGGPTNAASKDYNDVMKRYTR